MSSRIDSPPLRPTRQPLATVQRSGGKCAHPPAACRVSGSSACCDARQRGSWSITAIDQPASEFGDGVSGDLRAIAARIGSAPRDVLQPVEFDCSQVAQPDRSAEHEQAHVALVIARLDGAHRDLDVVDAQPKFAERAAHEAEVRP